ncbi:hypothetical protein RND81_04G215100 [Saponaria officinalis]|uniref:Uncharacterized protein n=1 Tax=Saponaria officinalis TaxID=3572 RepID=A0AAW1LNR2_SAPOF
MALSRNSNMFILALILFILSGISIAQGQYCQGMHGPCNFESDCCPQWVCIYNYAYNHGMCQ